MAFSWSFDKSFAGAAEVQPVSRTLAMSPTPDPSTFLRAAKSRDPAARRRLWLIWGTLALVAVFLVLVVLDLRGKSSQTALADVTGDLLMHSQRLARVAPAAVRGDPDALAQMRDSRDRMTVGMAALEDTGTGNGADPRYSGDGSRTRLATVLTDWQTTRNASATILDHAQALTATGAALRRADEATSLLAETGDAIVANRLQAGAPPRDVSAATQLQVLNQRLGRRTDELSTDRPLPAGWSASFSRDVSAYRDAIDAVVAGIHDPEQREKGLGLQKAFTTFQAQVATIGDALSSLGPAKQAATTIATSSEPFRTHLVALRDGAADASSTWNYGTIVTGVLALLGMLVIARSYVTGATAGAAEAERGRSLAEEQEESLKAANEANQAAILRLMNELQEVADGNLTMQATVSEDITGAIADSINYTVEELRTLVGRINSTVQQVTGATSAAEETSNVLLVASDAQSREIRSTGDSVLTMARQISDVSGSAAESAAVARRSLAAAEDGQRAVQNSISGMNEIREQIQETSKRIKRLGESSQEIGEIIELISDITEQTNVLALNAAIQAASAGEAGRGFSVVAEEVQRLAERSGEATKQIGALVRTIQTDTQDAVAAMEKSTEGVVEGAKLSDAAGQSLANIGRVSRQLAELIEAISRDTSVHAQSAGEMASSMEQMLVVNEQTSDGTRRTAASIQQLGALALDLKNSVARFKVS